MRKRQSSIRQSTSIFYNAIFYLASLTILWPSSSPARDVTTAIHFSVKTSIDIWDSINAIALQTDGKIVVAGKTNNYDDFRRPVLARYNDDGSLDTEFGGGDGIVIDIENWIGDANALVLQSDGKIIIAGFSKADGSDEFALARFNTDGSVDRSFGTGNVPVITKFDYGFSRAYAMSIQSDGKIVVAGMESSGNGNFALARYLSNGALDNSFGISGKVSTEIDNTGNANYDKAYAMIIQSDGKIVLAGTTVKYSFSYADFAVARYNTNGSLDTSFNGGVKITDFAGSLHSSQDIAYAITMDNQKIIAAGLASTSNGYDFALVRLNNNGSLDSDFGVNGLVTTNFGSYYDQINAILMQGDKILVAGSAWFGFALARYNNDGSLDTSYGGGDGKSIHFHGGTAQARALALQPDGAIIVGGYSGSNKELFALARTDANGKHWRIENGSVHIIFLFALLFILIGARYFKR